ncbi:MAG: cobalt-precorrin 5A hydrolase [Oscillospiraceae bacterium]
MKIRIVSYSDAGGKTAEKIASLLNADGHACTCWAPTEHSPSPNTLPLSDSASAWAAAGFREADALIFCCAAGIAVRAIAPSVKSKQTDPAVLVVDERGNFVIPILSGHLGGANALALEIADKIGALPVVTTATDLNGIFAVDVFAQKNHLRIESMQLAKEISAALLAGKAVGFRSELSLKGQLPAGLTEGDAQLGICVTTKAESAPFEKTLRLFPLRYAAGLGCRRGKRAEELEAFFLRQLADYGVRPEELRCVASIALKRDEAGLTALCEKYALPFLTFSAEELRAVPGEFSASAFVEQTTGVDSVCERAAVLASGGRLIRKKTAADGMTFALAQYEEEIRFD